MKLLIASDIHGSYYYLRKLLDHYDSSFDSIILLGDILYHGPRNNLPKEYEPLKVVELLKEYKDKIICIKGNCDAEIDELVLPFELNKLIIIPYNKDIKLYFTHGHIYNKSNLPKGIKKGDYLFYGHEHISYIENADGINIINPGSISIPKDNKHSFIIMDDCNISINEL